MQTLNTLKSLSRRSNIYYTSVRVYMCKLNSAAFSGKPIMLFLKHYLDSIAKPPIFKSCLQNIRVVKKLEPAKSLEIWNRLYINVKSNICRLIFGENININERVLHIIFCTSILNIKNTIDRILLSLTYRLSCRKYINVNITNTITIFVISIVPIWWKVKKGNKIGIHSNVKTIYHMYALQLEAESCKQQPNEDYKNEIHFTVTLWTCEQVLRLRNWLKANKSFFKRIAKIWSLTADCNLKTFYCFSFIWWVNCDYNGLTCWNIFGTRSGSSTQLLWNTKCE